MVIDTPEGIAAWHKLSQYHACRMHMMGMRHSSGRSIFVHVKQVYGFKGSNAKVLAQFKQMLINEGILSE